MNRKQENKKLLSANAATALKELSALTRSLLKLAEEEEQILVLGDMLQLAAFQDHKEKMAWQYMQGSNEFRERLEEFRGLDSSAINELEKLQNELNKKTQSNNSLIEQIRQRAMANTQSTLLSAQELGNKVHVHNGEQATGQESA